MSVSPVEKSANPFVSKMLESGSSKGLIDSLAQLKIAESGKLPKLKMRCSVTNCKARISAIDMITRCKCGQIFCSTHRGALKHPCKFNHLEAHRALLRAKFEGNRKEFKVNVNVNPEGSAY